MIRNMGAAVLLDQALSPIGEQLINRMRGRAHRADDGAEDAWIVVALVGDEDRRERIVQPPAAAEALVAAVGKRRHNFGKSRVVGGDNAQTIDPEWHYELLSSVVEAFKIARRAAVSACPSAAPVDPSTCGRRRQPTWLSGSIRAEIYGSAQAEVA